MKKDLLSIDDLTSDEIYLILDTSEAMREIGQRPIKKSADAARRPSSTCSTSRAPAPHLVRDRREAAQRRHPEHRGRDLERARARP